MVKGLFLRVGLALVVVAAVAACGGGETSPANPDEEAQPDAATAASPAPCAAGEPPVSGAADWPHPNYDAVSSRATFTSTITAANVGTLREAWRYELPRGGRVGAAATTPIIAGSTVYLGDLFTNVHAIDFESGARRWIVENDQWVYGPSGVAVSGGCVFANLGGHSIAAYRVLDGGLVWATSITEPSGYVNFQPLVVGGTVFAATSSLSQPGVRGTLYALEPSSGEIRWSFDTIVSEDLWGNPDINSGGGAWYPPSIDLEAGVSYWGIANPYPFPGVPGFPNGTSRPGDNRWTDSILAIDIASGELLWGHQAIPHDIFDRDAILTGIATVADGRQVIISTGKMGRVIGLDPDGTVLWDTPVGMHLNDDVTSFEGELDVMPGASGGVVTPIAVTEGRVYVSVVNAPVTYRPDDAENATQIQLGSYPSQLVAVDAASGEIVWDVELPGDGFGGATVVNDLVFTSVIRGQLLAFDRATGELVWKHQAPGGINGWPAVAGDTIIIPIGFGDPGVLLALRLSE